MERTYNLSGVAQVEVHEQVYSWVVRGEKESGFASMLADFSKNAEGEAAARALAVQWCNELSLTSYVVQTFADRENRPYWFHLADIDIASGAVIEERDVYYGS